MSCDKNVRWTLSSLIAKDNLIIIISPKERETWTNCALGWAISSFLKFDKEIRIDLSFEW